MRGEGQTAVVEMVNNRPHGVVLRYRTGVRFGWSEAGFGLPELRGLRLPFADGLYIPALSRASVGVDRIPGSATFQARPGPSAAVLDVLYILADKSRDALIKATIGDGSCRNAVAGMLADGKFGYSSVADGIATTKRALEVGFDCRAAIARALPAERRHIVYRLGSFITTFGKSAVAKAFGLVVNSAYGSSAFVDAASGYSLASFTVHGTPPPSAPAPTPTPTPAPAPAPAPGSSPSPAPAPAPAPAPSRRIITVDNRVTNGMSMREDSTPARLTTQPWVFCGRRGCNINGTERSSGQTYDAAVCQAFGERTTNGNDGSAADDANPERFESTRYYGVRLGNGTFGYVSETWIRAADRGGLGLPGC